MEKSFAPKSGFGRVSAGLMVATGVTLCLDLLFTPFLSLLFNNYEAYWVIGIGMLGFGAGGAVVAAGTELEPAVLAMGVPARVIRGLTAEERERNRQITLGYVETARAHACLPPVETA